MVAELRQRRSKKDADDTSAFTTTSASSEAPNNKVTPIEQLRNAQARLVVSRERTADLHTSWRNQLFRVSFIVIFVCLHQLQSCVGSCIQDIKAANESSSPDLQIPGLQALLIVFGLYNYELLGVVISFSLAFFLAISKDTARDLDHWTYILSSALVPMCLGCYFQSTDVGCLGDGGSSDSDHDSIRQFPAVVIYHTVITMAFWFMKSGMDQCEEHVQLVTQSIIDFERMDKKLDKKRRLAKAKR